MTGAHTVACGTADSLGMATWDLADTRHRKWTLLSCLHLIGALRRQDSAFLWEAQACESQRAPGCWASVSDLGSVTWAWLANTYGPPVA